MGTQPKNRLQPPALYIYPFPDTGKALSTSFEKTCKSRLHNCFFSVWTCWTGLGKRFPSVYLATSKTRAWLLPLRTAFVNKGSRPCFRDHLTPIFLSLKLVLKNFRKKSKFSRSKFFHLEKWSKIFEKSQNFISRIIDINLVSNHLFVINVHCESGSKFFQP